LVGVEVIDLFFQLVLFDERKLVIVNA